MRVFARVADKQFSSDVLCTFTWFLDVLVSFKRFITNIASWSQPGLHVSRTYA